MIAHPGLPQIRTCRTTASGSSSNSFASLPAHRVDRHRVRKAVSLLKSGKPTPRGTIPAFAAHKPLPPNATHLLAEPVQHNAVARDSVVGVVPAHLLTEYLIMLGDRSVSIRATPLGYRPDGPGETARRRLPLDHPIALPGTTPVVREAQQVERPGAVAVRPTCR